MDKNYETRLVQLLAVFSIWKHSSLKSVYVRNLASRLDNFAKLVVFLRKYNKEYFVFVVFLSYIVSRFKHILGEDLLKVMQKSEIKNMDDLRMHKRFVKFIFKRALGKIKGQKNLEYWYKLMIKAAKDETEKFFKEKLKIEYNMDNINKVITGFLN